jgi:predicted enzyme related to lactoylglutathione lyase
MGNPVTHFQILSKKPDEAARFYATFFGWRVDSTNPLGYRTIDTGARTGATGGIWPAPPEAQALITLYVEVDDVATQVGRATQLGGRVVVPPQTLPEGDEMAVILDPEGIPFGLMRRAKMR